MQRRAWLASAAWRVTAQAREQRAEASATGAAKIAKAMNRRPGIMPLSDLAKIYIFNYLYMDCYML